MRLALVVLLAAATELLAPWHLGWSTALVALGLSVTRMRAWGPTVLDRLVPLLWAWIAVLAVLGWVVPFAPWAAHAWLTTAVAGLPFVSRGRARGSARVPLRVSAREWAAAVVPVGVLAIPLAVQRDLAGVITQLGVGWDTVNHLALLRGALLSPGVTLLGPEPDRYLNPGLLGYPSGAHQVWAAWARTAGLPGNGTADVVVAYPFLVVATWLVLTLTLVWAYRRLVPWGRGRTLPDALGLAALALGVTVGPLPSLWASGFHNYALAVAGLVLLAGLAARRDAGSASGVWLATAVVVVVATTYPLLAPAAGVGWVVVAVLAARRNGRRASTTLVAAAVAGAVAVFPAAVPYLDPSAAPDVGATAAGDQLTVTGGLGIINSAVPVLLVALALAGAAAWGPLRHRMRRSCWVPTAAAVLWAGTAALTLARQGVVGYYPDKLMYAVSATLLPLAAAGAAALALGAAVARSNRRRPSGAVLVRGAVGAVALVVAALALAQLPHDALGSTETLPGPEYLVRALGPDIPTFVSGDRVVAATAAATEAGQIVVPLDALLGPRRVVGPAFTNEQNWLALLGGADVSAARMLANLSASDGTPVAQVACLLATFAHNHPDVPVLLLVGTPQQEADARAGLASCKRQPVTGVSVAVSTLPAPLAPMRARTRGASG